MNLFAPQTYAGLRRPLLEAETLPTECYLSDEFYRREVENIFMKGWNLLGRVDYVKKPGDYFTRTLVGVSLIIMRGADSKIRAFINACRHRGTMLLDGNGQVDCVRCPYHGWSYNIDGSLRSFFKMDDAKNLDPKEFGLVEVKLETWQGFIFVNFDSNSVGLTQTLGKLGEHTESYNWEDMVTVGHREVVIKTNWKSYVENSMEPIHLPLVHQKSIGHVFATGKAGWEYFHGDYWAIMNTITDKSRAVLPGDEGFDRLPDLRGTAARGAQYIHVNPCTTIGGDLDCMWFKNMVPEGPHTVRNIAAFCFPKSALARPDYDRIIKNYMKRFYQVIDEDNDIAERQFLGITNPMTRTGRYSKYEQSVYWFNNWVVDRVVGPAENPQRLAAIA
jgi:phenylpropionate dioxygenase-like ring-hydroxylating dioxygenase large terminal subunit